jgi:hypothetical protein
VPGNPLEELHVELQPMPRLRLLVALPPLRVRPVLLIRRQAAHAVPYEDAVHRADRHADLVKPLQIAPDPPGPKWQSCRRYRILLTTSGGVAPGDRLGIRARSASPASPSSWCRRLHL